ncbi:MAG: hypothetical protein JWP00_1660 [Chloroflexi bacterium]|jgi:predicted ribosomally synthesized peptide with nif11-like leader|nr:hypothetical protein [Chloroflexota bacterium]
MSSLNAQEFISRLASDPAFRSQVGIVPTMPLDEFQSKAAAAGYNFTSEEILAAAETQQGGALSDQELEDVSGGARSNLKISITVTIKF